MTERIPDEALVIRGGRNQPTDLKRGTRIHPSGVIGVSVESGANTNVEQLSAQLPHGQIGITTVGAIRAAGGDVVRTSGRTPHHATVVDIGPEQLSKLLSSTIPNPARKP